MNHQLADVGVRTSTRLADTTIPLTSKEDLAFPLKRRRGIHPTVIVDPGARLAEDVTVGAYAIIEGRVTIGPGGIVFPHSIIQGSTIIGLNCRVGPAAYVGFDPQHTKFVSDASNPTYEFIESSPGGILPSHPGSEELSYIREKRGIKTAATLC